MEKKKRLFLFAAYDQDGVIDSALIHYLNVLSRYGDIVFCMDNKFDKRQIKKLKMHPLSVFITRHKEYDFGSYKRCFQYAQKNDLLKNYEYLYLVNDSVFGPMYNIGKILQSMERSKSDAVGLIKSIHKTHSFMESWFVCLNQKIFLTPWFDEFISSVKKESDKTAITVKYEHGLTNLIQNHNLTWSAIFDCHGRYTYNHPKKLFLRGCPFIKKASFTRHNGALGRQINYVLKHSDTNAVQSVMKTAKRIYGKDYMNWFLTSNPLKIFMRYIKYIKTKITGETI